MVIAGTQSRGRFIWSQRKAVSGADGLISPALLPFNNVHFLLGSRGGTEVTTVVPVQFAEDFGLRAKLLLGDKTLIVSFKLSEERTTTTAAAGALLASIYHGTWQGDAFP